MNADIIGKHEFALSTTFSYSRLIFLIDSTNLQRELESEISSLAMLPEIRNKFQVKFQPTYFPPSNKELHGVFKTCAMERLFIPNIFPEYDAIIYVDTDVIFMVPPEMLWKEFQSFSSNQMLAMAPTLSFYHLIVKVSVIILHHINK